jgi:hypothetical protein
MFELRKKFMEILEKQCQYEVVRDMEISRIDVNTITKEVLSP